MTSGYMTTGNHIKVNQETLDQINSLDKHLITNNDVNNAVQENYDRKTHNVNNQNNTTFTTETDHADNDDEEENSNLPFIF